MRHQTLIVAVTAVLLALASIALVRAQTAENTGGGTGTAFIVHPDGLWLTAEHVVEGATSITVSCNGRPPVPAIVRASSAAVDIAVLEADGLGETSFLRLSPGRIPSLGDDVFTIGYPTPDLLGTDPVYTNGTVSSLSGIRGDASFLQVSVPVQPGNSGGPLVDDEGEVVGVMIVTAAAPAFIRATDTIPQNINWAVKSRFASVFFEPPAPDIRAANESDSVIERVIEATCLVLATSPGNSRREAAARPPRAADPPATRRPSPSPPRQPKAA